MKETLKWIIKNPKTVSSALMAKIIAPSIIKKTKVKRPSQIRDYDKEVVSQLKEYDYWNIKTLDSKVLVLEPKKNIKEKENILITAGIHGSEPAGVLSIIENLE